jgi:hypothetical protein
MCWTIEGDFALLNTTFRCYGSPPNGIAAEGAMKLRIAFAVFAGATLISASAFAACPAPPTHQKNHAKASQQNNDGCVDFNGLPEISDHIIAAEPSASPVTTSVPVPVPTTPIAPTSNGLTVGGLAVGLTKPDPGIRPTPTVGYKWSLD